MRSATVLSLFLMLICTGHVGATDKRLDTSSVDDFVKSRWEENEPGGAVIILKNGKVAYEAYHGLSNIEQNKRITAETIFPYASVTKRLTAATILSLVESGAIELDAPVGNYLPTLKEAATGVTIRQLLTHSSGIPGSFKAEAGHSYTTEELVQEISKLPLQFAPGSKSGYSNNGYNLLGAVIEKVTGYTWHETVLDRTVKPLELSSIGYLQNHIDAGSDLAVGYWEELQEYKLAPVTPVSLLYANGAMAGNIRDLAFWVHGFHHGQIISQQSLETALEKRLLANGKPSWGMGLFNFESKGEEFVVHDGGASGINVNTVYLPGPDIVIVTATNVPVDARDLANGIADRLLGRPHQNFKALPLSFEKVKSITGTYILPDKKSKQLFLNKDALFVQYEGQRPMRVLAAGDDTYFIKRRQHWFKIAHQENGATELQFFWYRQENPVTAIKSSN